MATRGGGDDDDDGDRGSSIMLGGTWRVSLVKTLGRGTFGTVYRGRHIENRGKVAVKKIEIPNDESGSEAMKEIKNFQRLETHPNIVYLYDFHYRDKSFWMVMEFCNEGDLSDYMKAATRDESVRMSIMMQATSALAHMHCMADPIVHRDIKPQNILLKTKNGELLVKVTDFGLSKMVDVETMAATAMFATQCGTPGYMAPELFIKAPYGPPVDVFAMALVFTALIYHQGKGADLLPLSLEARKEMRIVPIGQEMAINQRMRQPMPRIVEHNRRDSATAKGVKQLIERMTVYEPRQRPSMKVVEEELAKITGKTYTPREVKSGLPLFNRRGDADVVAVGGGDNEGATGTAGAEEGDVAWQFNKDALEERMAAVLGEAGGDLRRGDVSGMGLMDLLKALREAMDDSGGAEGSVFEIGDRVRVKEDVSKAEAERLQKDHGEWNDRMHKYFGEVGYVKQVSSKKVVIKHRDGETWIWNPVLVEKYSGPEPSVRPTQGRHAAVAGIFRPMDVVRTPEDKEMLQCLQELIGMKWTDKMEKCVGKTGIVHKIDRDGDVIVELINGLSGPFNPEGLVHVDHSGQVIEAGDMVLVNENRDVVKQLQEGHGGWNNDMAKSLGKAGMVVKMGGGGDRAVVEVGRASWHFNVKCLSLVVKGDEFFRECRQ